MAKADFVLSCSGVIPLLALTLLIELRVFEPPRLTALKELERPTRVIASWLTLVTLVLAFAAEFICLHALEVDHISHGQVSLIWAALAFLSANIGFQLILRIWV